MISSGGNIPDFGIRAHIDLLVALHHRAPLPQNAETDAALVLLREKHFVSDVGGRPRPSVFIAGLEDERWLAVSHPLIEDCANLVRANLPAVRERLNAIANFNALPFERVSLLVLSDVLLDNWQIDAVEREFVRAERPMRGGGRYYFALLARCEESLEESFGIYGNQTYGYDGLAIGIYGNKRVSATSLPELSAAELQARFGLSAEEAANGVPLLARRLAAAARGQAALSPQDVAGFQSLDLVDHAGRVSVPVLSDADYEALDGLAALIREPLIARLNSERDLLSALYGRSPYARETSFEEYLIWWYHVFYTAATDRLIAQYLVQVPPNGVATYIMA